MQKFLVHVSRLPSSVTGNWAIVFTTFLLKPAHGQCRCECLRPTAAHSYPSTSCRGIYKNSLPDRGTGDQAFLRMQVGLHRQSHSSQITARSIRPKGALVICELERGSFHLGDSAPPDRNTLLLDEANEANLRQGLKLDRASPDTHGMIRTTTIPDGGSQALVGTGAMSLLGASSAYRSAPRPPS